LLADRKKIGGEIGPDLAAEFWCPAPPELMQCAVKSLTCDACGFATVYGAGCRPLIVGDMYLARGGIARRIDEFHAINTTVASTLSFGANGEVVSVFDYHIEFFSVAVAAFANIDGFITRDRNDRPVGVAWR
jgi:hypothetical protein